jgi:hypothetical protein
MDSLFLDANVLFSAAYGSRGLGALWDRKRLGLCRLLASSFVLEEAKRNLDADELLARLDALLLDVALVPECDPGTPCPLDLPEKDRPVLMAAIKAGATHLITGDLRHFGPCRGRAVHGVQVMTARDYVEAVGARG